MSVTFSLLLIQGNGVFANEEQLEISQTEILSDEQIDSTEKVEEDIIDEVVDTDIKEDNIEKEIDQKKDQVVEEEVTDKLSTVDKVTLDELEKEVVSGNIHLLLTKSSDIIPVGFSAQFQLYVTTEGTKDFYEDVTLVISLPKEINGSTIIFDQDLEELKINGQLPVFDEDKLTLTYHFELLAGGIESSVSIKITTVNGSALNNVELDIEASIEATNLELKKMSESVTLSADANVSLTNILDGILIDDKLVTKSSVRYEDTAVFSTGISVMKLESGTLKTDKNKQIKFTYKLPEGFTYVSNSSGQEPTIGEELVWLFDSNMNEDEDYYLNMNFSIVASLDTEIVPFTKVVNTATASIDFIDGSNQLKNSGHSLYCYAKL